MNRYPAPEPDEVISWSELKAAGTWRSTFSPFTQHYRKRPEHHHVWSVGLELQRPSGRLLGLSYFTNSFGQRSSYSYLGQRYDGYFEAHPKVYWQWTAGILYGYRPPHNDEVPLNYKGFSPAVIPSIGWQPNPDLGVQLNMLGNAALMLQLSYRWR